MNKFLATCLLIVISVNLQAHSGRTAADGCHKDSRTGTRHCHNNGAPSNEKPVKNNPDELLLCDTRYNRDDWKHWIDADGDCQDTRQEVLIAQGNAIQLTANTCRVSSGNWFGYYGGETYIDPSDLDIDHIIPLGWAHAHGAACWSAEKKERFANDPLNLLAVSASLNRQKGAKGPDAWIPPRTDFYCDYILMWRAVMNKYSSLDFLNSVEENALWGPKTAQCGR